MIADTFTDPVRSGGGERHRLRPAWREAEAPPVWELVGASHECWALEVASDAIDTPLRLRRHPRRRRKPVGVIQALDGLLLAHSGGWRMRAEAALRAGRDPDRLRFRHTVRLVCDATSALPMVAPEHQPLCYQRLLWDSAGSQLPARDTRRR